MSSNTEKCAKYAFASVLRQVGIEIEVDFISVTKGKGRTYTCVARDPQAAVEPLAEATYYDELGGQLRLISYFDPKIKFWSKPNSMHQVRGDILRP